MPFCREVWSHGIGFVKATEMIGKRAMSSVPLAGLTNFTGFGAEGGDTGHVAKMLEFKHAAASAMIEESSAVKVRRMRTSMDAIRQPSLEKRDGHADARGARRTICLRRRGKAPEKPRPDR